MERIGGILGICLYAGLASAFAAFLAGDLFGLDATPWASVSFWIMAASGLLLCYGLPLVGIVLALPGIWRDDP